jgi:3-methylcrotonyl-CoA carboxylase alpha subunit
MKLKRPEDPREFEAVIIGREAGSIRVSLDGEEIGIALESAADGATIVRIGDRRLKFRGMRSRNALMVAAGPANFTFAEVESRAGGARRGSASPEMTAPMPGKVLKVLVSEGQAVAPGDPLIVLEAMKMETTLFAEGAAVIRKIRVEAGQMVDHGAVLIELSAAPNPAVNSAAASSKNESPVQGT